MLVSLGITTIFQTNFNMDRVTITILPFTKSHAESITFIRILIENRSTQPVYHLTFKLREKTALHEPLDIDHLPPKQSLEIELPIIFYQRGYQDIPTILAETKFPLGLLRSWKWIRSEDPILIYPAKKGNLSLPMVGRSSSGRQIQQHKKQNPGDEFLGHRPYHQSDSLRQIDWKAYARSQKLNIKLFDNEDCGSQLLSWHHTSSLLNIEAKISQLAQWVGLCQRQKLDFVLELPQWTSSSDHSQKHIDECFERLALFQNTTSGKLGGV